MNVDTSELAKKDVLASIKSDVDKLDLEKLQTVPNDLTKLSNAVDNNVAKKVIFNGLNARN